MVTRRKRATRRRTVRRARRRSTASTVVVRMNPRRRRKARRPAPRRGRGLRPGIYRPTLVYSPRAGWRLPRKRRGKGARRRITSRLMKRGTRVNPQFASQYGRINPRRRRYSRRRRNPGLNLRTMFNRALLMRVGGAGLGIAAGFMAKPLTLKLAQKLNLNIPANYAGGLNVVVGLMLNALVRNRMVKDLGLSMAATGVYDLIAANTQEMIGLPIIPESNRIVDQILGASYAVPYAPVSAYGRGVGLSYQAGAAPMGEAYAAPGMDAVVLGGTNPYEGVDW